MADRYQAESATRGVLDAQGNVIAGSIGPVFRLPSDPSGFNTDGEIDGGYADFNSVANEFLQWTVNATTAGAYQLAWNYILGQTGTPPADQNRPMRVEVNGVVVRNSLDFTSTSTAFIDSDAPLGANGNDWDEKLLTVQLNAGPNTVRIVSGPASGGNYDWLEVRPATDTSADADGNLTLTAADNTLAFNQVANAAFTLFGIDAGTTRVQVSLDGGTTRSTITPDANGAFTLNLAGRPDGDVTVTTFVEDAAGNQAVASTVVTLDASPNIAPIYLQPEGSGAVLSGTAATRILSTGGTLESSTNLAIATGAVGQTGGLRPGHTGTGYLDFGATPGDTATFTINMAEAGLYDLSFRYAGSTARPLNLSINNGANTQLPFAATTLNAPQNEAFNNWQLQKATVTLLAGVNTIAIAIPAGATTGPNIDAVAITTVGVVPNFLIQRGEDAPTAAPIAAQAATENSPFTLSLAGVFADDETAETLDGDADTIVDDGMTVSIVQGPAWLSLNTAALTASPGAALTGTPGNADVGTHTVTLAVTDRFGGAPTTTSFQITVANVNDVPAAGVLISPQTATEDAPFTFAVPPGAFTDIDAGDSLTFSATLADGTALPAWLNFDGTSFSGTPRNGDVANLIVRVTATDGAGATAMQEFTLGVTNTNDAPTLAGSLDDLTLPFATGGSIDLVALVAADIDAGDQAVLVAQAAGGGALPEGFSLVGGSLVVEESVAPGSYALQIVANDGEASSAPVTFSVTVAEPALVAVADAGSVTGRSVDIELLGNDENAGAASVIAVTQPGNANVVLNGSTATVSITQAAYDALGAGATATASFSYTAADSDDVKTASVTATFIGVNDAPTLGGSLAPAEVTEGIGGSIDLVGLVALDVDQGDPLSLVARLQGGDPLPTGVSLVGTNLVITAAAALGNYAVEILATDGTAFSAPVALALTVAPPAAPYDAVDDAASAAAASITIDLLANDLNTDDVSVTAIEELAGVTLAGNTATVAIDPAAYAALGAGQSTVVEFTYTATDAVLGDADTATATATFLGVNDAPTAAAILGQAAIEDALFTFAVPPNTFSDVDTGDTLGFSATLADGTALPSWLQFDAATQTFSGTPGNANVGSLSVRVTATDTGGLSTSQVFALTVANTNDAPTVAAPIGGQTVAEDAAVTLTVPAGAFADIDVGDTLTLSATLASGAALPSWLSFNAATRSFSGTPTNADVGSLNVRVTATDVAGASASQVFALAITNTNDAPTLSGTLPLATVTAGTASLVPIAGLTFNDVDVGDTVSLVARLSTGNPLPSFLTFNGTSLQVAANAPVGNYAIQVVATDAAGATSAPVSFTLAVQPGANPVIDFDARPIISFGNQDGLGTVTFADGGESVTLTGNLWKQTALEASYLVTANTVLEFTYQSSTLAEISTIGLTRTALSTTQSYTKATGPLFQVGGVQTGVANMIVLPDPYEPSDGARQYTIDLSQYAGQRYTYLSLVNDDDRPSRPGTATFSDVRLYERDPSGGSFDALPDPNIVASVGTGSLVVDVLANDVSSTGTPAVTAVSGVTGGNVTLANGVVTASLDPAVLAGLDSGETATVSFTYTAGNGSATDSSTASVIFTGVNDAPVVAGGIANQARGVGQAFNFTLPANAFSDVDVEALTTSVVGNLPAGVTFANGAFSGAPTTAGNYTITVAASDGQASVQTSFVLAVEGQAPPTEGLITFQANRLVSYAAQDALPNTGAQVQDGGNQLRLAGNTWKAYDLGAATPYTITANTVLAFEFSSTAQAEIQGIGFDKNLAWRADRNQPSDDFGFQLFGNQLTPKLNQSFSGYDTADGFVSYSISLANYAAGGSYRYLTFYNDHDLAPQNGTSIYRNVRLYEQTTTPPANNAPILVAPVADFTVNEDTGVPEIAVPFFTDADGDPLSVTYTANGAPLPAWLSAAGGAFTGTPGNADVGLYTIVATASDGRGGTATDSFVITVANVNDAPFVSGALDPGSVVAGDQLSYTLPAATFTDIDANDTLSLRAELASGAPLPGWLSFNATTRSFTGSPAEANVGALDVRVIARDAAGAEATTSFALNVLTSIKPPEPVFIEAENFTFLGTATNFFSEAGGTSSGSANLRLDAFETGSVSTTLATAQPGRYLLTVGYFFETDGVPTASAVIDGTTIGAWAFTDGVFTNPNLPTGPLREAGNAKTITFTNNPFYVEAGSVLTLNGTATANALARIDFIEITPTEAPPNRAPVPGAPVAPQVGTEDQGFSLVLPANLFTDPDRNDTFTLSASLTGGAPLPSWLSFDAATRSFSGTPGNNDTGPLAIVVTATDAAGLTATQAITLNVAAVNDAPTLITLANATVLEETAGAVVGALSVQDVDSAAHSFLVSDARFTVEAGVLKLKPGVALDRETEASVSLSVTATDAGGLSVTQGFTLAVGDVDEVPVVSLQALDPLVSAAEAGTAGFRVLGLPSDTALVQVSFDGGTTRSTVTPAADGSFTASLAGRPDGAVTATVFVTDLGGNVGTATASTVLDTTADAGPALTLAVLDDTLNATEAASAPFQVTGIDADIVSLTASVAGGPAVAVTPAAGGGFVLNLSGQPDGEVDVTLTATDAAGNTATTGATAFKFTGPVDNTADADGNLNLAVRDPLITAGETAAVPFTVTGRDADIVSVAISFNGGATRTTVTPDANGAFSVNMAALGLPDGPVTATLFVTDTAGNVAQDTATFTLDAVANLFTLVVQEDSGVIAGVTTGTTPTTFRNAANPEAITATLPTGLQPGFTGNGYLDFGNTPNDSITFTVNVPSAGTYAMDVTYANGGTTGRPLALTVNNGTATSVPFASTIPPGGTGTDGFANWSSQPVNLTLNAGSNTIKLAIPAGATTGPNIDRITLTGGSGAADEPFSVAINFQPQSVAVPAGYTGDFGDAYTDARGYGWVTEASVRDANPGSEPIDLKGLASVAMNVRTGAPFNTYDAKQTTYAHFDLPGFSQPVAWEHALDNGFYSVTVSIGDSGGPLDSFNVLNVEGQSFITPFTPTAGLRSTLVTKTVQVTDGKLTLDSFGGDNTEIQYIEITELPDLTPGDGRAAPLDYATFLNPVASLSGQSTPLEQAQGIDPRAALALDVNVVNAGGVDQQSLNTTTVKLINTLTGASVAGTVNTSGGFDTLVFQPDAPLAANTSYTLRVDGVTDITGTPFQPYSTTFVTGASTTPQPVQAAFTAEQLVAGDAFSSLVVSPDGGKLYAASLSGSIYRWDIAADGDLVNQESFALPGLEDRPMIGIAFDPTDSGRLWVSSNGPGFSGAADFSGKISYVDIGTTNPATWTVTDYVVGLPRSIRDHLSNSLAFREDPANPGEHLLYLIQGSNSAMGAPDSAWGFRPERLLNAAVLEIDPTRNVSGGPINVQTENPAGGNTYAANGTVAGFYNPFAADAPVSLFATGIRNAYDLVWHSNGSLYVPTNGSAAGGNTPDNPNTAADEGLNGVGTQPDLLFKAEEGKYYGHPNALRGEYVLNGGNPTSGTDPLEVVGTPGSTGYAVGVAPPSNYGGAAFDFGRNRSPNGAVEFTSDVFGGTLKGALLVTEYSGGDDILALTINPTTGAVTGSAPLRDAAGNTLIFGNPLDIALQESTGRLYVAGIAGDQGPGTITLLRPVGGVVNPPPPTGTTYQAEDTTVAALTSGQPVGATARIAVKTLETGFQGTGYVDWGDGIASGETLTFSIPVAASGTYNLTFTYSLNGTDRPLALAVNGANLGNLAFTDTDGAGTLGFGVWSTLSQQVTLVGGQTNTIALTSTGASGPNIDQMQIAAVNVGGPTPPTITGTGRLEAETATLSGPVVASNNAGFSGAGFADYSAGISGEYVEWSFRVAETGSYALEFGYALSNAATNTAGRPLTLSLNGASQGSLPFLPAGPDFVTWGEQSTSVALTAGTNYTVRLTSGAASGPNIDYLDVVKLNPTNPNAELVVNSLDPAPFEDWLVFSHIDTPTANSPSARGFKSTATLRLENSGTEALEIYSANLSGPFDFIDPAFPASFTIAAGQFRDIGITFDRTEYDPATQPDIFSGQLVLNTNDVDESVQNIQLRGFWQTVPEGGQEPTVSEVWQTFGYTTTLGPNGEARLNNFDIVEALGDEVLSSYWTFADGASAVTVTQLAALHGPGGAAFAIHTIGNKNSAITLFDHGGNQNQSLLPTLANGSIATATFDKAFVPYAGDAFGFRIAGTFSTDATLNAAGPGTVPPGTERGHFVRLFEAFDREGDAIPGTYLMIQDYTGINYDYNDNMYVITGIKPYVSPATRDTDGDGLVDINDPFFSDATNGRALGIGAGETVTFNFDGVPAGAPAGWGQGFTGIRINGTNTPEELGWNDGDVRFANGSVFIDNVQPGDTNFASNSLQDGLQLGFTPEARYLKLSLTFDNPFDDQPKDNFSNIGMSIGTGNQSDFVKLALEVGSTTQLYFRTEVEVDDARINASTANFTQNSAALQNVDATDTLTIEAYIDTQTGTLTPVWRFTHNGAASPTTQVLTTVQLTGDLLDVIQNNPDDLGIAVGLHATSIAAVPYDARFDSLTIQASNDAFVIA